MRYQLQRKRKSGPYVELEDPAFRSKCISLAATGVSRRAVAALMGKPEATVRGWINRGLSTPDDEPYTSFAADYQRAEQGLAHAIAETKAMKVQLLREQMTRRLEWESRGPAPVRPTAPTRPPKSASDEIKEAYEFEKKLHDLAMESWRLALKAWETPPPTPEVDDLMWMERVRISRYPQDYGTSKHRKPDVDYSGQEWLDEHTMQHEQLSALFSDPPDSIRGALVAAAPAVYAILLAGGFDPEKAATNAEEPSREGNERTGAAGHGVDPERPEDGAA